MSQSDKQTVQEIMTQLREEVKEIERTAWLYEQVNEQVSTRVSRHCNRRHSHCPRTLLQVIKV